MIVNQNRPLGLAAQSRRCLKKKSLPKKTKAPSRTFSPHVPCVSFKKQKTRLSAVLWMSFGWEQLRPKTSAAVFWDRVGGGVGRESVHWSLRRWPSEVPLLRVKAPPAPVKAQVLGVQRYQGVWQSSNSNPSCTVVFAQCLGGKKAS